MPDNAYLHPKCWCGEDHSIEFSTKYQQCTACKTLFLAAPLPREHFEVAADESGFYGEKYWTEHIVEDYGLPHIRVRTRTDLPERNLYWLRALLRYLLPPKKVLEVACAHGSFVALLRRAGFDAAGLDVSPAILEYARQTFGIPTILGPAEKADLPLGELHAIAAMDVLEHFPQPVKSMQRLVDLLREDGVFLIQTPCLHHPDGSYQNLVDRNDRFLVHLKEDEHIYLFNKDSARLFFERLGFPYVEFLEPIFDYDMFLAASRRPLTAHTAEEIAKALTSSVDGRMTLALLDLDDQRRAVYDKWQEAERDRAARLEVIADLNTRVESSEADRAARLEVIHDLGARLSTAEGHRNEAEAECTTLRQALDAAEADRAARLQVIEDLGVRLAAAERARNEADAECTTLRQALDASEADRAARLQVIEDFGVRLAAAERARNQADAECTTLRQALEASEADRAARLQVIEDFAGRLSVAEAARSMAEAELKRQAARIRSLAERNQRLGQRLDEVRRKLTGTVIGRALTAAGWIHPPVPDPPDAT